MKNYFAILTAVSILSIGSFTWAAPTITLTITAGTNTTSHRIEKQTNGGTWSTLTSLAMPTVTYTDSAVALSNSYCYRAYGVASLGESAASAPCCSALFAPGTPSGLNCSVNP